jgi:hypothetical protein
MNLNPSNLLFRHVRWHLIVSALLAAALPAADAPLKEPSIAVVRFDDVKPKGAKLTTCWDALGIDEQQRVYIAFSDQNPHTPNDTVVFRYDTRTGARELLGTLRQVSAREGNLREGETIAKSHVPFHSHEGKLYFSSHDYHSYKGPEDLLERRGGHFYSFDVAAGTFEDLSKSDPGGVSVPHQGIIGLAVLPESRHLFGFTFPFGDLLLYDLEQRKTTLYPGVPAHRDAGKPSRQIFATANGKVYFSYYDTRPAPLYVFDTHERTVRQTEYRYHFGMVYGAERSRDGRRVYLVDLFGNLYVFHTDRESLEDLGSLLPPDQIANGEAVTICYSLTLSPDGKRLYTFPSRLSSGLALRLYEYDLDTGGRRQVADFTSMLNGAVTGTEGDKAGRISGGGVVDAQGRMYFGYHEGGDEGRNAVMLQVTLPR